MLGEDREQDLAKLTKALILVEVNRNTSASRTGLETRGANLDQIAVILLDVLDLTERELEDMYWDHIGEDDGTNTGQ